MQKNYINEIIKNLKSIYPEKIILFGSYVIGNFNSDSDIDLIVVTKDDFYPKNYRERMDIQLKVSRKLDNIAKNIPVDLIVYTKPMFKKFLEIDSLFAREINQNGKIIYESHD